jgi:hypothetical protein
MFACELQQVGVYLNGLFHTFPKKQFTLFKHVKCVLEIMPFLWFSNLFLFKVKSSLQDTNHGATLLIVIGAKIRLSSFLDYGATSKFQVVFGPAISLARL